MNKMFSISIIATLALSACSTAKKADDVAAVRSPVAPYLKMTCPELYTEERILLERLDSTRKAVDKSYQSDKTTEVVTWLLFAPAAFMLEGNQKEATEFASTKGQYDAVHEAIGIKKCASEMTAHSDGDARSEENTLADKKGESAVAKK